MNESNYVNSPHANSLSVFDRKITFKEILFLKIWYHWGADKFLFDVLTVAWGEWGMANLEYTCVLHSFEIGIYCLERYLRIRFNKKCTKWNLATLDVIFDLSIFLITYFQDVYKIWKEKNNKDQQFKCTNFHILSLAIYRNSPAQKHTTSPPQPSPATHNAYSKSSRSHDSRTKHSQCIWTHTTKSQP